MNESESVKNGKDKKALITVVAILAAIFAVQSVVRAVNPYFFKDLDDKYLEQRAELNYDSIDHELHKNGEIEKSIGRDNPKQALADLDALLQDHPKSIRYLNTKGLILHDLKRFDEAIACFSRAIHIRSDQSYLFCNRGLTFMDAEKFDEALADYNRALELEPDDSYVFNNRGSLWLCKGENRKAVDDLTQAIIANPKDERAYTNRAFAYNNLKEYGKAIEDHNHVVALAPNSAIALTNRAWSYMRLNRNDMAVKDCDKALSFGQKVPGVFLICAEAYMANRDFQKAINCCNDLLKIDPHSQFALDTRKKAEQMLSAR